MIPDDIYGVPPFLSNLVERVNYLLSVCRKISQMEGTNGIAITWSDGLIQISDGGSGGGSNYNGNSVPDDIINAPNAFSALTERINWICGYFRMVEKMSGTGGVSVIISDDRIIIKNSGTGGGVNSSAIPVPAHIEQSPFILCEHMKTINRLLVFSGAIERMQGEGGVNVAISASKITIGKA